MQRKLPRTLPEGLAPTWSVAMTCARRERPDRVRSIAWWLGSLLTGVEHQAVHREFDMNVRKSSFRQRVLLLLFGHVQRSTRRRIIEWSVVADQDQPGDGKDSVNLLVQPWCVPFVAQFMNSLHGKDAVKPARDATRPVVGFEAGEDKGSRRKPRETFPARRQHGLGEIQKGIGFEARASLQHPVSQEAWSRTNFKSSRARRQRRDAAGNVVSELRPPGALSVSRLGPSCHFCSAVPIVAVGHILFLQGVHFSAPG